MARVLSSAPKFPLGIAVVLAVLFIQTPSRAQDGTPAQRNACKPDVFRLCKNYIPDRTAITACLERNVKNLSPDCREVFSDHHPR